MSLGESYPVGIRILSLLVISGETGFKSKYLCSRYVYSSSRFVPFLVDVKIILAPYLRANSRICFIINSNRVWKYFMVSPDATTSDLFHITIIGMPKFTFNIPSSKGMFMIASFISSSFSVCSLLSSLSFAMSSCLSGFLYSLK